MRSIPITKLRIAFSVKVQDWWAMVCSATIMWRLALAFVFCHWSSTTDHDHLMCTYHAETQKLNAPTLQATSPKFFYLYYFGRFYYFGCWLRIWRHFYPVNNWNQWRYHFEIWCFTLCTFCRAILCRHINDKCNTSFEVNIFMLKFDIYLGLIFVISDWNKKKTTFPAYSLVWLILVNFTFVRPPPGGKILLKL